MATDVSPACYVYVLRADEWSYKIGRTKNIQRRIKQLQTGSKENFTLVYYMLFPDCAKAEQAIHTILSAYRIRREWFQLNIYALELLKKIFNQENLSKDDRDRLQRLGLLV